MVALARAGDGLVAGLLHRAANLLAGGHARGVFARTAAGTSVCVTYPSATCFCVYGALMRAASDLDLPDEMYRRAREFMEFGLGTTLAEWNDRRATTPADGVALCQRVRQMLGGGA